MREKYNRGRKRAGRGNARAKVKVRGEATSRRQIEERVARRLAFWVEAGLLGKWYCAFAEVLGSAQFPGLGAVLVGMLGRVSGVTGVLGWISARQKVEKEEGEEGELEPVEDLGVLVARDGCDDARVD